jgi:hypothetical protein
MSFFVTSVGPGKGADLGGIETADRYCQQLASTAGAGNKTWRAYLSTQAADGKPAVNARDRIGNGPWQNFKGEVVAQSIDDLHSDNNKLGMQTSLTENGRMIPGVGFAPTATTRSPARERTAALSHRAKTVPAAIGPAAPRAAQCSVTSIIGACATMPRHTHGIRRILHEAPTAAAAKTICAAPVVTGCSIVLPHNRRRTLTFPDTMLNRQLADEVIE